MRLQPILFAVVGLVLVGGSLLIAQGVFSPNTATASQPQKAPSVYLITAAVDIPFGSEITRDKLWSQKWPAENVPEGAFADQMALLGAEGTAPRRASKSFAKGELIVACLSSYKMGHQSGLSIGGSGSFV